MVNPQSPTPNPQLPIVVIVGPTASGKTALAIDLAERLGGEIISADSRAIYRHMDIGTAKPTHLEQSKVKHWGLDLVNPGERYSVADFKAYAEAKIVEIRQRHKIPFLVGGTGLYVDSVLFDYDFGVREGFRSERQALEKKNLEELKEYCLKHNIKLPKDHQNKRRLIGAIERNGTNHYRAHQPISTSIIVGIATNRNQLRARIRHRAEQILQMGVVEEATWLGENFGWNNEAMTGNIYPLIKQHLDGELSQGELIDRFAVLDWQLAKRQMTWFRRNPFIYWGSSDELERYISNLFT